MQSELPNTHKTLPLAFSDEELTLIRKFCDAAVKSYPGLILSVALTRVERGHIIPAGALPTVVIIDDARQLLNTEDVMRYVKDMTAIINRTSTRIHLETLRLTDHWRLTRDKDKQHLDFLRNCISFYDTGFLGTSQILLTQGRLRPSMESTGIHYANAQRALKSSQIRVMQAAVNLYWAAIDSAHAAILRHGGSAPPPSQMAEMLTTTFVAHRKLEKKYPETMDRLYHIYKDITHGTITELRGEAYDTLLKETILFVEAMRKLIRA